MAGMVKEVNVKVNDKVSQGSLILKLEPPTTSRSLRAYQSVRGDS